MINFLRFTLMTMVIVLNAVLLNPYDTWAVESVILTGEIVKVERSDLLPYSYYYYMPESCWDKPVCGIIHIAKSDPGVSSYEEVEDYTRNSLVGMLPYADSSGFIMFSVSVPGSMPGPEYGAAHELRRSNFETATGMYYRPDLKFIEVLNHFKSLLSEAGVVVDPKIFVTGFSAGGMWAHRFPLLHPELVKAAAPGAAGVWTMPLESYQDTFLRYSLGIQDLGSLGVEFFNIDSYRNIPFYIFVGSDDTGSDPLDSCNGNGLLECSVAGVTAFEAVLYRNAFGNTPPERAHSFHDQLISLGMYSTFKSYTGVAHEWTNDMKSDTINFFKSIPLGSSSFADIKANGSDGPLTIGTNDTLSITVSLEPGNSTGDNADWWMAAYTPFDWYYYDYDLSGGVWLQGLSFAYQGPLFNLSPYEVLNMSGLAAGNYTFYFGVDMNMNGIFDMEQFYYDSLEVDVLD